MAKISPHEVGIWLWAVTGGLILIALISSIISIYNMLIMLKYNVSKAWSNIDVLLKQRLDELEKLVDVCKTYMKYEQETLQKVISLRSLISNAGGVGERLQAEGALAGALKTLFAVAENYPDLKADNNFAQLRQRISYLENEIADRREFYNESVNLYNIKIAQIPAVLLARPLGYQPSPLFEIPEAERENPKLAF
ncbi:MAG: LemA family protein [Candidatus Omnitrophica bacterium]|nr:LemA family protein [Candidatus Omnitrophota bacterium]